MKEKRMNYEKLNKYINVKSHVRIMARHSSHIHIYISTLKFKEKISNRELKEKKIFEI